MSCRSNSAVSACRPRPGESSRIVEKKHFSRRGYPVLRDHSISIPIILQSYSNHTPIILQSYSNHTPIILQSYSNHTPIILQSYSNHTPIILQSYSNHTPIILQSYSNHTPIILQSYSNHTPIILQSYSNHTPIILQSYSNHTPIILQSLLQSFPNNDLKISMHGRSLGIPSSRFGIFSPINADRFSNQSPIQVSNPDRWQSDNEIQRKISGFNQPGLSNRVLNHTPSSGS